VAAPTLPMVRARIRFLHYLLCLVFLALAGRLVYLQGVRFPDLSAAAARLRTRGALPDASRGQIYDCNGVPLATNADLESVFADPSRVDDPAHVAAALAPLLQLDPAELAAKLGGSGRFVWVRRKVKPEVAAKVKALGLEGVGTRLERKRMYSSEGAALANVLGFAGTDNNGLEGLEREWDPILAGSQGVAVHDTGPDGASVRPPPRTLAPAQGGRSLVLTIDARVQRIAAEELRLQCLRLKPKSATLTVLDPRNGDVLAMCSYPSFDPNHFAEAGPEQWRNRSVCWTFEPGRLRAGCGRGGPGRHVLVPR
jgi:cell division protein FtsI/penicillin-binding protein 2